MSFGFRLSIIIFVLILLGLGMFWLSVGIVGKKVRIRPFLIYAVCFGASYLLSIYLSFWLFSEETVFSGWYNVLHPRQAEDASHYVCQLSSNVCLDNN